MRTGKLSSSSKPSSRAEQSRRLPVPHRQRRRPGAPSNGGAPVPIQHDGLRGDGWAGGICRASCQRYCGDRLVIIYRSFDSRCFYGVFTVFRRWDPRWDPCVFAPIPADPAGFFGAGIRIPPKLGAGIMIPAGR